MAAPSNTVWGSIVNSKAKLGISVTATSTTNTSVTLNVQVWLALKYNINDSSNQYYFTYTNDSGTSVTSPNGTSLTLKFGTTSGAGWAESSQKQLGSYNLTYTRGTSAKTVNFSSKLNNLAGDNYNVSASTSYKVPAKPSYTISYNANGGSGAPSAQTKWYGTTLTLSPTKPTRTGYSFSKWNTAANGSGTSYNSGASYTANASATLYAQWTANTYAVTYNANGGTGAPANQTKTYGVDLTLSNTAPTRTNYNFLGWATTSTATTPTYSAGSKYTANAPITLYAVWELAYVKPRITNFAVDRCDQDGNPSDTGTYALVKFDWECDLDVSNVRIEWKISSASSYSSDNGTNIPSSGKSGSVAEVVGNGELSAEYTYNIRVGVADSTGSNSTVKNLNPMVIPLDVLAGGTGVSIGKPASLNNTFEVAWNSRLSGLENHIGNARVVGKEGSGIDSSCYIGMYQTVADTTNGTNRLGWLGFGSSLNNHFSISNETADGKIYLGVKDATLTLQPGTDSAIFCPTANNLIHLGSSNYRWKDVYAVNGTIQTSDANLKTNIENIDDKYVELFSNLRPVTFEFKENDSGRTHVGFISQEVKESMDEVGLTDLDFAGYCRDVKQVVDENSEEQEYIHSLRYTEFIALNTYIIQRLQKEKNILEERVTDLELRLKAIEDILL